MSLLEKVNNFIGAFIDALKSLLFIRLWTPFFLFALLCGLLAAVILNPFNVIWSWIIIPLGKARLFGGDPLFVQYPQHLLLASSVYSRLNLIISILIDSLLSASAFVLFAGFFAGEKTRIAGAIRKASSRYLPLVLASVLVYVILLIVAWFVPELFRSWLVGSPRREIAFDIAFKMFLFLVLSPFVYIVPYLVLQNEKLTAAIRKSFKTWSKNIFTTYFIVAVGQALVIPFSVALDFGISLARSYSPEILIWLLFGEVFAYMIASFLFTAMLTRVFFEYHE